MGPGESNNCSHFDQERPRLGGGLKRQYECGPKKKAIISSREEGHKKPKAQRQKDRRIYEKKLARIDERFRSFKSRDRAHNASFDRERRHSLNVIRWILSSKNGGKTNRK